MIITFWDVSALVFVIPLMWNLGDGLGKLIRSKVLKGY